LPTVVIAGVRRLPGHEGQGRVTAAEARQAATRAEHVHLDRLGREAEQSGDFLGLQMAGDQTQDLPLTRSQTFKACGIAGFHHDDSMRPASRDVQRKRCAGRHKIRLSS